MRTVRDATFDVFRQFGLTTLFANPGSTEISLLTDLPDDLQFVLALHESSVVGMATGFATVTERPALVNLHTTAGLAVGAPATAPQDVPSAVARAWHEATDGRGPAIAIVPSDDWAAPAEDIELAAPAVLRRAAAADPAMVDELAALLSEAVSRGRRMREGTQRGVTDGEP
jgi:thiamine pyrophosphate-dependent acetolactate synthase large subunit-like protein